MKKVLKNLILLALLIAVAYYFLDKNGYNIDSILNKPKTIDLSVDCSSTENLLLTSVTEVTVTNNGDKTHEKVIVRITAYDKNNDVIKEKNVVFNRDLLPYSYFSKPITLPGKTVSCNCVIFDSTPQ